MLWAASTSSPCAGHPEPAPTHANPRGEGTARVAATLGRVLFARRCAAGGAPWRRRRVPDAPRRPRRAHAARDGTRRAVPDAAAGHAAALDVPGDRRRGVPGVPDTGAPA